MAFVDRKCPYTREWAVVPEYDFGIWQSTEKIRRALEGKDVPPEVERLLSHIDGLAAQYVNKIKQAHAAAPGSDRETAAMRMVKEIHTVKRDPYFCGR